MRHRSKSASVEKFSLAAKDNSISEVHQCNVVTDINEVSEAVYFKRLTRSYVDSRMKFSLLAVKRTMNSKVLHSFRSSVVWCVCPSHLSLKRSNPSSSFQDDMILSATSVPLIDKICLLSYCLSVLLSVCLRIRSAICSVPLPFHLMERERKGGKRVGVSVDWADGSTFLGQ